MNHDGYKNGKKVLRRSFVIPSEYDQALEQIRQMRGLSNPSKAFRFCIEYTYEKLLSPAPATTDEPLLELVTKNHALLHYLLIEIIKAHEGRGPLKKDEKEYWQRVIKDIAGYYEKLRKENHAKQL